MKLFFVGIRPLLPPLSLNLLINLLITGSYLLQALLFTDLILSALAPTATSLTRLFLLLVANTLVRSWLIGWQAVNSESLAAKVRTDLRRSLFQPLLAPGYTLLQLYSAAKLQSTLVEGVEVMEGFYSRYLPAWLLAIAGSALTIITLAFFDPLSGFFLLLFMILYPAIDYSFMRQQRQNIVGVFAAMQRFAAQLMDSLQGMLTLKAFNAVPRFRARMAQDAASLRAESMSTLRFTMMRGGITRFVAMLGVSCLLVLNAWRVVEGNLDPAVLLLTLFISWEAFRPILQLEGVFHTLWAAQEMRPALQTLSQATATLHDPILPHSLPASYDLRFEQVSFCWPGQSQNLFDNLSLTIAENSHTAFIGPSGSGKSTLTQLLMRFISPQQGTILLGGVAIESLSIAALRSRISWVSQHVFLMNDTLAENLRLSRPEATEAELWHALQQAQLADWVARLPQQLATPIGENGKRLSGGQRQRLAIARALLKRSPIIILDEVTANLDIANESALQKVIASLQGTCTLVTIAHRLNTVTQADHIVVLQQGRILEQGSPEQLNNQQGYYAMQRQVQEKTV